MQGEIGKFRWHSQGSTGLFVLLLMLVFVANLYNVTELLVTFYFGLLIIHRVVMELVIKRHFWRWSDEKVCFYSLLIAFILSSGFLTLVIMNTQAAD